MSTVTAGHLPSATRIVTLMAIIAGLYLGRELLIPFALAIFLSVLLFPAVTRLRRLGMSNLVAVSITITVVSLLLTGLGILVVRQAIDLTNQLPDYRENLKAKIRDIRPSGSGSIARLSGTISELKEELKGGATTQSTQPTTAALQAPATSPTTVPATQATETPVKVEVVKSEGDVGSVALALLMPLMSPIGTAVITSVLVIFFLLQGDDMRGRLITLAGMRHISMTTSAVDEATTRIGSFVRMQALVALIYAALVTGTLLVLGVPNAILWGVLGFILRFVPYVGPWMAAVGPSLLAIAVFPNWGTPLMVICAFILIETTTNMVLEPWFYGNGTGLTSLGVVICVIFWAWLWGAIGMVLAVPITACMVVLGKHVSAFAVLHRLFGCDVAVPQVGRLYQRALAGDDVSVAEIIERSTKKKAEAAGDADTSGAPPAQVESTLDDLILPAIAELKQDLTTGAISDDVAKRALAILEEALVPPGVKPDPDATLLLVAVQSAPDDLAAHAIAQSARARDVSASVLSSDILANEAAQEVAKSAARWIVLVQVKPVSSRHERRLLRAIQLYDESKRPIYILTPGLSRPGGSKTDDDGIERAPGATKLIDRIAELSLVKPTPQDPPKMPRGLPATNVT